MDDFVFFDPLAIARAVIEGAWFRRRAHLFKRAKDWHPKDVPFREQRIIQAFLEIDELLFALGGEKP